MVKFLPAPETQGFIDTIPSHDLQVVHEHGYRGGGFLPWQSIRVQSTTCESSQVLYRWFICFFNHLYQLNMVCRVDVLQTLLRVVFFREHNQHN